MASTRREMYRVIRCTRPAPHYPELLARTETGAADIKNHNGTVLERLLIYTRVITSNAISSEPFSIEFMYVC